MRWVATAQQIRALEARWFEDYGLAPCSLMEVAGRACADWIVQACPEQVQRGVWVLCGPGNNGGDGYVIARTLHTQGIHVIVIPVGTAGPIAAEQARICERLGVPIATAFHTVERPGLVVDALFGIGCTRKLEGPYHDAVQAVTDLGSEVVSIDIPSGICADTGSAHQGLHIRAHATLTFEHVKRGLYLRDGALSAGEVHVLPLHLGAPPNPAQFAKCWEPEDIRSIWPTRPRNAHKGHSGHLLVVAGSLEMAGAAALTVRGAFSVGVGRVTLMTPKKAHIRLSGLPPEAMLATGWDGDLETPPSLEPYTAVVAGPGLGKVPEGVATWLGDLWRNAPIPVVYDADALAFTCPQGRNDRILTPHPGEAGRLLQLNAGEVNADRVNSAQRLSCRGITLLKGRYTVIVDDTGQCVFNTTGSPTLATAGSGDVLAGIVGGLLARGVGSWDAACAGAWLHGEAGQRMEAARTEGWLASDIGAHISTCVPE